MKTKKEYLTYLLDNSPHWLKGQIGEWLFNGLAHLLTLTDQLWINWSKNVSFGNASDKQLEEIAKDYGVEKYDGETDEQLRKRLTSLLRGCTPNYILQTAKYLTKDPVFYIEPWQAVADVDCYADDTFIQPAIIDGGALHWFLLKFVSVKNFKAVQKKLTRATRDIEDFRPAATFIVYHFENGTEPALTMALNLLNRGNYGR